MKRRAAPVTYDVDGVPKAILIGMCVEVWATDPANSSGRQGFPISAWSNYHRARTAWLDSRGVPSSEHHTMPEGRHTPYSVHYMTANGCHESVVELLAAGGARLEDLPELRRQALELIAAVPHSITESR